MPSPRVAAVRNDQFGIARNFPLGSGGMGSWGGWDVGGL
eukprot:CAMPEP_0194768332 /NCGR_PEP_ID=MMETSP0323_2-20130528/39290_1 /TAXON_ID=2866 ORGANISM="Crypthecodinium cohnii, Strain Seligo" /NCGR_SAMPLE_ID=MMETSP0323_2 /ASSEMBLY_ACC=CAM_ASM_000346 /LENGTH=38 /DNA_ID= /DNA_START= /DNA_END= /DNA_ORIENTATION=